MIKKDVTYEEKKDRSKGILYTGSTYYSLKDEDAYFEWVKKMDFIDEMGPPNYFYAIASDTLSDYNLRDLIAFFDRYDIDMKQLQRFLNEENKHWFFDNPKAYWHKKVFGKIKKDEE